MGKKYIIELLDECSSKFKGIMAFGLTQEQQISVELIPEESLRPYTEPEPHAEVTADAYQRGYETAKHECEDCPKQAHTDALKMESYQNGLSDAWEAARKIIHMPEGDLLNIFTECYSAVCTSVQVFLKYDASECIEKIRAYEQARKEKEEQIQVGDEVIAASGKAVVTGVGPVYFEFVYANGYIGSDKVKNVKKTGRHFPEIAEVLQKMKEA